MAGKPVGLLSELIVLINNNDNAVHDVYRAKSWTVLVVTVTIKCLIVLSLFIFILYNS